MYVGTGQAQPTNIVGMLKTVLKPTSTIFGKRLREARLQAGLTQDGLGVAIGLDEGRACIRISRYESGVHNPSLEVLWELAKALDVPAAYLVTEDDQLAQTILRIHQFGSQQRSELDQVIANLTPADQ